MSVRRFSASLWMFVLTLTDITKSSDDVDGRAAVRGEWNVQMAELSWLVLTPRQFFMLENSDNL